jgi:hypothetical protein
MGSPLCAQTRRRVGRSIWVGFIFLPHGTEHAYTIQNEDTVRLLVITSHVRYGNSAGWRGFVADLELGNGELIAQSKHKDKRFIGGQHDSQEAAILRGRKGQGNFIS